MPAGLCEPLALEQKDGFEAENGLTSHGSMDIAGGMDDEHDDEDEAVAVLFRDVTGKLDMGKSGLIFKVFASAFSCRRHLARRF